MERKRAKKRERDIARLQRRDVARELVQKEIDRRTTERLTPMTDEEMLTMEKEKAAELAGRVYSGASRWSLPSAREEECRRE